MPTTEVFSEVKDLIEFSKRIGNFDPKTKSVLEDASKENNDHSPAASSKMGLR